MASAINLDPFVSFLHAELELGLTFALIAAHASTQDKFNRNQGNARRACDTARRFMKRIRLSEGQAAEFQETLAELERRIQALEQLR